MPRATRKWCTCEGPGGCEVHDPNLDGLKSIEQLPPALVLAVVVAANDVNRLRIQCDGVVEAVDIGTLEALDTALRALAKARRAS